MDGRGKNVSPGVQVATILASFGALVWVVAFYAFIRHIRPMMDSDTVLWGQVVPGLCILVWHLGTGVCVTAIGRLHLSSMRQRLRISVFAAGGCALLAVGMLFRAYLRPGLFRHPDALAEVAFNIVVRWAAFFASIVLVSWTTGSVWRQRND